MLRRESADVPDVLPSSLPCDGLEPLAVVDLGEAARGIPEGMEEPYIPPEISPPEARPDLPGPGEPPEYPDIGRDEKNPGDLRFPP